MVQGLSVTQDEVINELEREGFSLSRRTLGYWRGEGLLPPLEREGQQYYWQGDILDQVRTLCSKREKSEILYSFTMEGERFEVERVEIKRVHGSLKVISYLSNGSFMVTTTREESVNAITKVKDTYNIK